MDMEFSSDEELSTVEGRAKPIVEIVQPPVEPPPEKMGRQTTALMRLKGLLDRLYKQKVSFFFRNPVDTAVFNVPDYYEIIKQPMDLNTIRLRIQNSYYWNVQEAMDDVELMFDNCMLYNPIHNPVNIAGQEFRAKYRSLLSQIDVTNEQEIIKQTRKPLPKTSTVTRFEMEMQQNLRSISAANVLSDKKKAQKRKNQSEIPNTQPGKKLKQSHDVNPNLDGTNVFVLSTEDPLYELVPAAEAERIAETCAEYLNEFVPGNEAAAATTSDERLKSIDQFYEYVNGFVPGNKEPEEAVTAKEPEAAIQDEVGSIQIESPAANIQQEEIPFDVSDKVLESIDEAYQYVISFVPGNKEPEEAVTAKEPEADIQVGVDSIQTESADANMQLEEIPFDVSDEVVKSIDMFFANNGNQSATDEDQYLADLCSMNIAEQIAEFNDVFLAEFDTNESAQTNTQNDKPYIFDPMIGEYLSPDIADDLEPQNLDFFTTDVYETSNDIHEVIPEEPEIGGYSGFKELAESEAKNMDPVEAQQDEMNNQAGHMDVDKNCVIKTHVVTSQGVYGTSNDEDVEAYIDAYVVTSQDFDSDVLRSLANRTIDLISPISNSKSRRPSAEKAKIFIHKFKGKEMVKIELSEDDVESKVEVTSEVEDGNVEAKVKEEVKVGEKIDGNKVDKVKEEIKKETNIKEEVSKVELEVKKEEKDNEELKIKAKMIEI